MAAVDWVARHDGPLPFLFEWTGREWETLLDEALPADAAERLGGPPGRAKRVTVFVNTARPVIDALTEGPDGRLYLLLAPGGAGGSRSLERFDPLSGALDRTGVRLAQGFPAAWRSTLR